MSKINNRALGIYLQKKPAEIREIFESIEEAFEECGLAMPKMEIADLYQSGALPRNWELYIDQLDARKVISEVGGVKVRDAEIILKAGFFDSWILLKSACNHLLGEAIPEEFEELVIKPGKSYLKIGTDAQAKRQKERIEDMQSIKQVLPEIEKAVSRMSKNEKFFANGGEIHSIYIKFNQILEIMEIIEERENS